MPKILNVPKSKQKYSWDCGPHTFISIIKALKNTVPSENEIIKNLNADKKTGTDPLNYIEALNKENIKSHLMENPDIEKIKKAIISGNPVALIVQAYSDSKEEVINLKSGHWVVLVGSDKDYLYFIDPLSKSGITKIKESDFLYRWKNIVKKNQPEKRTAIVIDYKIDKIIKIKNDIDLMPMSLGTNKMNYWYKKASQEENIIEKLENDDYKSHEELISDLENSVLIWREVRLKNENIVILSTDGKKEYVAIVHDGYNDFDDIFDWFYGISDIDIYNYVDYLEENDFWEGVSEGYFLYHATDCKNIESIKEKGLIVDCKTRAITNRNMPCAVFSHPNDTSLDSYGDCVIGINVGLMKKDGYMPKTMKENGMEEAEVREILAHKLGIEDFDIYDELNKGMSQGLDPETIAFLGNIPPKYLIFPENIKANKSSSIKIATKMTQEDFIKQFNDFQKKINKVFEKYSYINPEYIKEYKEDFFKNLNRFIEHYDYTSLDLDELMKILDDISYAYKNAGWIMDSAFSKKQETKNISNLKDFRSEVYYLVMQFKKGFLENKNPEGRLDVLQEVFDLVDYSLDELSLKYKNYSEIIKKAVSIWSEAKTKIAEQIFQSPNRLFNYVRHFISKIEDLDTETSDIDFNSEINIKEHYYDGICPDCGMEIPENSKVNDSCKDCGHVFNLEYELTEEDLDRLEDSIDKEFREDLYRLGYNSLRKLEKFLNIEKTKEFEHYEGFEDFGNNIFLNNKSWYKLSQNEDHININFDPSGTGSTPNNLNIEYLGFTKYLTPNEFLSNAAPLQEVNEKTIQYFIDKYKNGEPISNPTFYAIYDEDKNVLEITGHEGRHRMEALRRVSPNEKVPVHIFPQGLRARHFVDKNVNEISFVPEKYSEKKYSGKNFIKNSANIGEQIDLFENDVELSPFTLLNGYFKILEEIKPYLDESVFVHFDQTNIDEMVQEEMESQGNDYANNYLENYDDIYGQLIHSLRDQGYFDEKENTYKSLLQEISNKIKVKSMEILSLEPFSKLVIDKINNNDFFLTKILNKEIFDDNENYFKNNEDVDILKNIYLNGDFNSICSQYVDINYLIDNFPSIFDYYSYRGLEKGPGYETLIPILNEYDDSNFSIEEEDLVDLIPYQSKIEWILEEYNDQILESIQEGTYYSLKESYSEMARKLGVGKNEKDLENFTILDLFVNAGINIIEDPENPEGSYSDSFIEELKGGVSYLYEFFKDNKDESVDFSENCLYLLKQMQEVSVSIVISGLNLDYDFYKDNVLSMFKNQLKLTYPGSFELNFAKFIMEMCHEYAEIRDEKKEEKDEILETYHLNISKKDELLSRISITKSEISSLEDLKKTGNISIVDYEKRNSELENKMEKENRRLETLEYDIKKIQEKLQVAQENIPEFLNLRNCNVAKILMNKIAVLLENKDKDSFFPKFCYITNQNVNRNVKKNWIAKNAIPFLETYLNTTPNPNGSIQILYQKMGPLAGTDRETIPQNVAAGKNYVLKWLSSRVFDSGEEIHNCIQPFFDHTIMGQQFLGKFLEDEFLGERNSNTINLVLRARKDLIEKKHLIPGEKNPPSEVLWSPSKKIENYIVPDKKRDILAYHEYSLALLYGGVGTGDTLGMFSVELLKEGYSNKAIEHFLSKINFEKGQNITPYSSNHGNFDFVITSKLDPINVVAGDKTNCCFSIGDAAESSLVDAFTNPDSGFLIVYIAGTKTLVAQSWIRLNYDSEKTPSLYLDNIETVSKYKFSTDLTKCFKLFAEKIKKDRNYKNVYVGKNLSKIIFHSPAIRPNDIPRFPGAKSGIYSDLSTGAWIIANKKTDKNWYKISGVEDFVSGIQNYDINEVIEKYPNESELNEEQKRNIRSISFSTNYGSSKSKTKLFLKYPQYTYYSLYVLEQYFLGYNPEEKEILLIWNKMDKEKDQNIPDSLPAYIYNDIAKNYTNMISTEFATNVFRNKTKYPGALIYACAKKFPDLYKCLNSNNPDTVLDSLLKKIEFPNEKNIEESIEITRNMVRPLNNIDGTVLSEEEYKKEKEIKNQNQKYFIDFFVELNKEEKKLFNILKRDSESNFTSIYSSSSYWNISLDSANLYLLLDKVLDSYKNKNNYIDKDSGFRVYNFTIKEKQLSYISFCGNLISKEILENIIKSLGSVTKKESEFSISKYDFNIYLNGEKKEVSINSEHISSPDNCFRRDRSNTNLSGFILQSFPLYEELYMDIFNEKYKNIIDETANENDFVLLKTDPLFYLLGELAGNEASYIFVNRHKVIDRETYNKISNPFSYSVTTNDFLELYKKIISKIPQNIRKSFEKQNIEHLFNFKINDPLKSNTWTYLCSGVFSPEFIQSLIEKWPEDARKVRNLIKSNSSEEVNNELKEKIDIFSDKKLKNLNKDISEFLLGQNNSKLFHVSDFPELKEFSTDFLNFFLKNNDKETYNYQESVNETKLQSALKNLEKIEIYIVDSHNLIEQFGEEQLRGYRIHPENISGFYSGPYNIFQKPNPIIVIFSDNTSSAEDICESVSEILGMRPIGSTGLNLRKEQTLWHETTHGLIDLAIGDIEKERNYYENTTTWLSDIEEVLTISYGNLDYIKNRVSEMVERTFPKDKKMIEGFIENLKKDLIKEFPLEFYGVYSEKAKIEIDEYVKEELPEILSKENMDSLKQSIVSMFSKFFLSKMLVQKFDSINSIGDDRNKLKFPSDKIVPEVNEEPYVQNKKDEFILELEKRSDYQDFINKVKERIKGITFSKNKDTMYEYKSYINNTKNNMSPIFTIYDLIRFIYDQNFYSLSDVDVNKINPYFEDIIPESLLNDITEYVIIEKEKLNIPLNIQEPEITSEEAEDLGNMIYDTRENIGKGWEWLAFNENKLYKKAKTNWYKISQHTNTLVCIDIQEEWKEYFSNIDMCDFFKFINSYDKTIYVVDSLASGIDFYSDYKAKLPKDLAFQFYNNSNEDKNNDEFDFDSLYEYGECPVSPKIDFQIKNYGGILREAIDAGMDNEVKFMLKSIINKDINEEKLDYIEETIKELDKHTGIDYWEKEFDFLEADQLAQKIYEKFSYHSSELIQGIPNDFWKSLGSIDICGGGINECLAEVTAALDILDVQYNIINKYTYGSNEKFYKNSLAKTLTNNDLSITVPNYRKESKMLTFAQMADGGKAYNTDLQIDLPPTLNNILNTLKQNNSYGLLVGGAVRDKFLGLEPKDLDIEVYGISYEQLFKILSKFDRKNSPDVVGKSFGIIKITDNEGNDYDFSIPRRESKTGVGHQGFSVEFDPNITPKEAAARRDFTINSLSYDPLTHQVFDYFGGVDDIQNKILKATSPAFAEDSLRALRGMQFAGRFGFSLEDQTAEMIRGLISDYPSLAKERVSGEWMKFFTKSNHPGKALEFLIKSGWIKLYPEINAFIPDKYEEQLLEEIKSDNYPGISGHKSIRQEFEWHPEGSVLLHTIYVLEASAKIADEQNIKGEDRAVILMSALCHDLGKATHTKIENKKGIQRVTSPGHEEASVPLAKTFLESVGIKKNLIDRVLPLVGNHMQHITYDSKSKNGNVRQIAERIFPATIRELELVIRSDMGGRPPLPGGLPPEAEQMVSDAREHGVYEGKYQNLIQGRDLIEEFNLKPGIIMGETLKFVRQKMLEGLVSSREEALIVADDFLKRKQNFINGKDVLEVMETDKGGPFVKEILDLAWEQQKNGTLKTREESINWLIGYVKGNLEIKPETNNNIISEE